MNHATNMKDKIDIFLEEHGLIHQELDLLTYITKNPLTPLNKLIEHFDNEDKKSIIMKLNNLIMLGFLKETTGDYWHLSKKGELLLIEYNHLTFDEKGMLLSHIIEIGAFASTMSEMCGINIDWIKTLAVIEAIDCEWVTLNEICAYMENANPEILQIKLFNKTDPSKIIKLSRNKRYLDFKVKDNERYYKLSDEGKSVLELALNDWKNRIS